MASQPVSRARKGAPGIVSPNFPAAPKPESWEVMNTAERLEVAFACALDRAVDYLMWAPDQCDPHMLSAQKEAVRVMLMIGARYGIAQARDRARLAALQEVAIRLVENASKGNVTKEEESQC